MALGLGGEREPETQTQVSRSFPKAEEGGAGGPPPESPGPPGGLEGSRGCCGGDEAGGRRVAPGAARARR